MHCHISQETQRYTLLVNNFQIMSPNGGSMKCGVQCENVEVQIGDYFLKDHMFSIKMGSCDIGFHVEWLRTLGPITVNFFRIIDKFLEVWEFLHPRRSQSGLARNC